jgi:hypothetical protein
VPGPSNKRLEREVHLLDMIHTAAGGSSSGVIKVLDVVRDENGNYKAIVLPLAAMDLANYIQEEKNLQKKISEEDQLHLAYDLLSGLQ